MSPEEPPLRPDELLMTLDCDPCQDNKGQPASAMEYAKLTASGSDGAHSGLAELQVQAPMEANEPQWPSMSPQ